MVKVRVGAQAVPPSTWVTVIVGVPQLSVAVTCAFMLSSVGVVVGLHPKSPPVGALVITGAVVSSTTTVFEHIFVQPLLMTVKLRVNDGPQPLPAVTLTV
jgi:hypothetical protein